MCTTLMAGEQGNQRSLQRYIEGRGLAGSATVPTPCTFGANVLIGCSTFTANIHSTESSPNETRKLERQREPLNYVTIDLNQAEMRGEIKENPEGVPMVAFLNRGQPAQPCYFLQRFAGGFCG